jgi:hypothetical protein
MMTFSSSSDLSRLQNTDPAQPVISKLVHNLDTDPVTVALMEPDDTDPPLADLCTADDVTLEGIIEQSGTFLVVFQTDYQYGIVLVIPDEDWLSGELRGCIEENFYN